jgi:adenine-specific DNA-methyltransferase
MLTDSVVEGRTGEDLLFHVLLDWGLELSVPIVREMVGDSELFVVDDGLLIACFVETLTREVITGIAQRQPERAVFRDSGFATDADRINAQQVFGQLSPHTELRTV